MQEDKNLEKQHPDYVLQSSGWEKLQDCFEGGNKVQKATDDKYLVKRAKEDDARYAVRKRRAVYYNKPEQIISTFQGHIWRKQPDRESLPDALFEIVGNVDRLGKTANGFFKEVTEMAQVKGVCWVLVDYPVNPNPEIEKQSLAEEQALVVPHGLRPYFVKIDPQDLLDWGFVNNPDGSQSLYYAVIRESIEVSNEPFLKRESEVQYRVIKPDVIEIWKNQKVGDKEMAVRVGSKMNTLGEIPIIPFYGKQVRFGVGKSAIHNIVDLALELYNKHSDKDNAEFMSAYPIPFFKMCDLDGKLKMGEGVGIASGDPNGDFRLVEFQGASIEALRRTEQDILQEMFDLALKQIRQTGAQRETAEAKRLDRLDATSDIQARVIGFEESEQKCWEFAADWLKLADKREQWIKYNNDFDIRDMQADLANIFLTMTDSEKLSTETLWNVLKRGELLDPDFNPDEEWERILEDRNRRAMPGFNNQPVNGQKQGIAEGANI